MLLNEHDRIVGQFGFTKSFNTQIIFPVEINKLGIFLHEMGGKAAAHGNIGAVVNGFFKLDIEGVAAEEAAHGHGQDFLAVHEHQTLHIQLLPMVQCLGQRHLLHVEVGTGICFQTGLVPACQQILYQGHVFFGDRLYPEPGMELLEFVQVIPLFLEFLSLQCGKILDIIEVVEGIPVVVKTELIRIQAFQQVAVFMAEAGKAAGNIPGAGIVDNGVDDFLYISMAQREQVDAFL